MNICVFVTAKEDVWMYTEVLTVVPSSEENIGQGRKNLVTFDTI